MEGKCDIWVKHLFKDIFEVLSEQRERRKESEGGKEVMELQTVGKHTACC